MLFSRVLKNVKFTLSFFLSIFKYRIFVFHFLTYLDPISHKNNSSVSRFFLPRHVTTHSRQLTYETNNLNIFNDLKFFLTISNSSVDYNFIFSPNFNFNATCGDNIAIPECILH